MKSLPQARDASFYLSLFHPCKVKPSRKFDCLLYHDQTYSLIEPSTAGNPSSYLLPLTYFPRSIVGEIWDCSKLDMESINIAWLVGYPFL